MCDYLLRIYSCKPLWVLGSRVLWSRDIEIPFEPSETVDSCCLQNLNTLHATSLSVKIFKNLPLQIQTDIEYEQTNNSASDVFFVLTTPAKPSKKPWLVLSTLAKMQTSESMIFNPLNFPNLLALSIFFKLSSAASFEIVINSGAKQ